MVNPIDNNLRSSLPSTAHTVCVAISAPSACLEGRLCTEQAALAADEDTRSTLLRMAAEYRQRAKRLECELPRRGIDRERPHDGDDARLVTRANRSLVSKLIA